MKSIRFSDPDEQYVFDERIGSLAEDRNPTDEQISIAIGDVWRFGSEMRALKRAPKTNQMEIPLPA